MKTTRRGAFGIGAGALTAGPGLAKEAMNQAQQFVHKEYALPTAYDVETKLTGTIENQKACLARRKQEFLDILSGKYNEYQKRELNNKTFTEEKIRLNIDSLKSVSEVHKHQMRIEKWKERTIKEWQDQAKESLERLLKGEIG